MNLTIERAPALSAISRVVGIVERRHTIPILSNVALSAADGRLSLRATDLDMEAIESLPEGSGGSGEITIPADKLHDIVRNADADAQIKIGWDETDPRVKVTAGRSAFRVPAMPAVGFPTFRGDGLGEECEIEAQAFARMLARVKWAVNSGKSASIDGCVYLHTEGDQIIAVAATNPAIAVVKHRAPAGAHLSALVPIKLVDQLIRWLGDADGAVMVSAANWKPGERPDDYTTQRLLRVRHETGMLTGNLYDAPRFLNYARVVADTHELTASTDQDALKTALKRALIMADQKTHGVRLSLADGGLTVQSRNDNSGEGADEIAADYDGPPASFLLSANNLESALTNLTGDVVSLCFAPKAVDNNPRSIAVVIKAPADDSYVVNLAQPRA